MIRDLRNLNLTPEKHRQQLDLVQELNRNHHPSFGAVNSVVPPFRKVATVATTTLMVLPCSWPAEASKVDCAMEPPTNSASARLKIGCRFMTCTPRCCMLSASITKS